MPLGSSYYHTHTQKTHTKHNKEQDVTSTEIAKERCVHCPKIYFFAPSYHNSDASALIETVNDLGDLEKNTDLNVLEKKTTAKKENKR